MRAVVIIQARMDSTRLPGKVLAPLAGRPMLYHVIERARPLGLPIVVATTRSPIDDPIGLYARDLGATVARGPEDDVLERFLGVARLLRLRPEDAVVRVCADAPLWCPEFILRCLSAMEYTDADYSDGRPSGPCAYQGAEVVRVRALETTKRHAAEVRLAREHVTAWIRCGAVPAKAALVRVPPWARCDQKLSVDTRADLERVRRIYDELYRKGRVAPLRSELEPGRVVRLREAVELLNGGER